MKKITLLIVFILLICLQFSGSSIVTIKGYQECDFTYINEIKCPNMINNEIGRIGSFLCELDIEIGKCYGTNERGKYEYTPNCFLRENNDKNLQSMFYSIYMSNEEPIKVKDGKNKIYLTFLNLGEQKRVFEVYCNNKTRSFYPKVYSIVSISEFNQQITRIKENRFYKLTTIISLVIAGLSLFILLFKKQNISVKKIDSQIFKEIKKIIERSNIKKKK